MKSKEQKRKEAVERQIFFETRTVKEKLEIFNKRKVRAINERRKYARALYHEILQETNDVWAAAVKATELSGIYVNKDGDLESPQVMIRNFQ